MTSETAATEYWKTDIKFVFQGVRGDPGELISPGSVGKLINTRETVQ